MLPTCWGGGGSRERRTGLAKKKTAKKKTTKNPASKTSSAGRSDASKATKKAAPKKVTKKKPAKKVTKQAAKKSVKAAAKAATKKVTKKSAKKTTKKVAKKATKKITKKVAKKVAKKATTKSKSAKKKVVKKSAAKAAKKAVKKTSPKKVAKKKVVKKPAAKKTAKSATNKSATKKSGAKSSGTKSSGDSARGKSAAGESEPVAPLPGVDDAKPPLRKRRSSKVKKPLTLPDRPLLLGPGGPALKPLIPSGAKAKKKKKKSVLDNVTSRRTKTPLTKSQLEHYRHILLVKRAELLGDMRHLEKEAMRNEAGEANASVHLDEQGSESYEQSLNLNLAASDRELINEIDDALKRITDRTYGLCELTHEPIKKIRLDELPWARYTIQAARELDQRGGKL